MLFPGQSLGALIACYSREYNTHHTSIELQKLRVGWYVQQYTHSVSTVGASVSFDPSFELASDWPAFLQRHHSEAALAGSS
jgi:hypothetical protein